MKRYHSFFALLIVVNVIASCKVPHDKCDAYSLKENKIVENDFASNNRGINSELMDSTPDFQKK